MSIQTLSPEGHLPDGPAISRTASQPAARHPAPLQPGSRIPSRTIPTTPARRTVPTDPSKTAHAPRCRHFGRWVLPLVAVLPTLQGQVLITRWDFSGGSLVPATGSGEAVSIGGTSATFAAGREGEPTGGWNIKSFPAQGLTPGTAGVEFRLSTEGLGPVSMAFQMRPSNTSANTARVLWSSDGIGFTEAGRFTVVPAPSGSGETWYDRVVALPPESANVSQLLVRVVSDFGSPDTSRYLASRLGSSYSPSGTWRFDNVSFSAVPEPGEYAAISGLGLVGFALWRRRRNVREGPARFVPDPGTGQVASLGPSPQE